MYKYTLLFGWNFYFHFRFQGLINKRNNLLHANKEKLYTVSKDKTRSTVVQIMNSLLSNSDLNWSEKGKPLDQLVSQFSRLVLSDSATPWTAACQASLYITNSQSSPKPMSIDSVMPSNNSSSVVPFSPALKLAQHQGLFKWVSSLH